MTGENNQQISGEMGCAALIRSNKVLENPPPVLFVSLENEMVRYCISNENMVLSENLKLGECEYVLFALTLNPNHVHFVSNLFIDGCVYRYDGNARALGIPFLQTLVAPSMHGCSTAVYVKKLL